MSLWIILAAILDILFVGGILLIALIAFLAAPKPQTISIHEAPWIIGKAYLIRTVTMIDTGVLVAVTPTELVLEEAAWIADTGRFSDAIAKAEFDEVEPFPDGPVIIGR